MNETEEMAARLRTLIRNLKRRADLLKDKNSPSPSEQSVLVWLDDQAPLSPRALADAQQVRPQTMQVTLDSLEGRRWVKRADHPTDRRQILFRLSPSGKAALEKGRRLRQAWLVGELRKLSAKERKTLTDALGLLERFLQN